MAVIKEYICYGEPVSSADLYNRYDFGIKPATIRMELLNLAEDGYLTEPYHAGGKVPTDEGLRFFAREMFRIAPADPRADAWKEMLEAQNWGGFLENFSKTFGLAGVLADDSLRNIHRGGLRYLFGNLDIVSDQGNLAQVVEDFEDIGAHLPETVDTFGKDFCEVFVGRNPLTYSENLSVMAADYDVGGKRVLFFAIGPKRMDYEKAAKILKGLKRKRGQDARDDKMVAKKSNAGEGAPRNRKSLNKTHGRRK